MFSMPIFRFLEIGMLGRGHGVWSTCRRSPRAVRFKTHVPGVLW